MALSTVWMTVIPAQATPAVGGGEFAELADYIEAQFPATGLPGMAVGVVRGGETVFLGGYGMDGPAKNNVTPQTPFVIGSVSKGFTSLAVMQLVEADQIDLDAPVQTYLPWFTLADPQAAAKITIRDLLNQTSGLGYNDGTRPIWDQPGEFTLEARIRQMTDLELLREPGTAFEYSNFNYMLLGAVVEAVSGKTYQQYIQEHIFTPLNMGNSFTSASQAPGLAQPHRWWFGFPVYTAAPYLTDALPAGYIISSAEDMAAYLASLQSRYPALLSPAGYALMHDSCVPSGGENSYCFGWVRGPFGGVEALFHEGAAEGYYSIVALDPASGIGVLVLSNANSMVSAPARDLAPAVLGHLVNGTPLEVKRSFWTTYLVIDLVVLAVSGGLIWSLTRQTRWSRKLAGKPPSGFGGWFGKVILPVLAEFIIPFIVLVFLPQGAGFPLWKVMGIFQPDLTAWVMLVVALFILRGLLRLGLAFSVVRGKK